MAVYKTIPLTNHSNRTIKSLSAEDLAAAKSTVASFVTYFKAKHS